MDSDILEEFDYGGKHYIVERGFVEKIIKRDECYMIYSADGNSCHNCPFCALRDLSESQGGNFRHNRTYEVPELVRIRYKNKLKYNYALEFDFG